MIFTVQITNGNSPVTQIDFDDTTDGGRIALHIRNGSSANTIISQLSQFSEEKLQGNFGFKLGNSNVVYIGNEDQARYVVAFLIASNYANDNDKGELINRLHAFTAKLNTNALDKVSTPQSVSVPGFRLA